MLISYINLLIEYGYELLDYSLKNLLDRSLTSHKGWIYFRFYDKSYINTEINCTPLFENKWLSDAIFIYIFA